MCIKKLFYVAIVSMALLGPFSASIAQENGKNTLDKGGDVSSDYCGIKGDVN